jgi:DNA-binding NtrC family response regulator
MKTPDAVKTTTLKVWHFDDNPYELEAIESTLTTESFGPEFEVKSFVSPIELAAAISPSELPDIVLLDIHDEVTGKKLGISAIEMVRSKCQSAIIVMRSSLSDSGTILECLRHGADDFISKKTDKAELSLRLYNAVQLAHAKRGGDRDQRSGTQLKAMENYAGQTMQHIRRRAEKIVDSAIMAVHVFGEPGTGKEVVAEVFRQVLPVNTPFVSINCGAISPSILESELFGHVKGAFTGAQSDRKGVIEEANGGWLFMDEVATLPMSAQVALLRVLENKEIKPVGGSKTKKVNVRILSATNERLEQLVSKGSFRKDLWQRLVEATIELKPLRERREEVRPLIEMFCQIMNGGPYKITDSAIAVLCELNWSDGNIRELRNCLRAMTEFSSDKLLTPLAIPARYWSETDNSLQGQSSTHGSVSTTAGHTWKLSVEWDPSREGNFDGTVDEILMQLIRLLHGKHNRLSVRSLSKYTGIAKTTLADKLRRLVDKKLLSADELQSLVGLESTSKISG